MTSVVVELRPGTLGEIADVIMGQSPAGTSYNRDGYGAPLINGPTEFTARHPVPKQWTTAPVRFCEPGDVLICVRGSSTGRTNISDAGYCIGRGVAAVRASRGNDQTFVQYALASVVADLLKLQTGSTFPSIDARVIRGGAVLIPGSAEQRRIGEALLDADNVITALERLIAKKQAIKRGMMQQLLTGETRLPGFPKPWSDCALGGVAIVNMGQSPVGSSYNTSGRGLPLVQGNADIKQRRTIDRLWTTQPTKRCRAGDVILTVRAPVGYTAVAGRDSCLGRGVCSLAAGDDSRFLFHALVNAERRWSVYEQGSTFTAVNSNEVRSFTIPWPADAIERSAIASVLDDADGEIGLVQERLAKARHVRQGMMQELLSGHSRLPVEEPAA